MIKLSKNEARFGAVVAGALVLWGVLALWVYRADRAEEPPAEARDGEPAAAEEPAPVALPMFHYIEITGGCGPHFDLGPCVNLRQSPGTSSPEVGKLRKGIVLKVEPETLPDEDPAAAPRRWHKVVFDGFVRYPERVGGDWYVAADPEAVRPFENVGDLDTPIGTFASTTKRIVVDLSDEAMYAYDGDTLVMTEPVSAGLDGTPTPRGTFNVYKKTPSRYMQGPLPGISDQYYDLPGVPWNLYFSAQGAVVHGAYWHDSFGSQWSHGCVNLAPQNARALYEWADLGIPVYVRD